MNHEDIDQTNGVSPFLTKLQLEKMQFKITNCLRGDQQESCICRALCPAFLLAA